MTTLQTPERRVQALETRVTDIENGFGESMYKLHRAMVKVDLRTMRILAHLGVRDVSDSEVDAAMDEA